MPEASEQTSSPKRVPPPLTLDMAILRLMRSSTYDFNTEGLELTCLSSSSSEIQIPIIKREKQSLVPALHGILILYNDTSDADGRMQE